jgi:hypothetical protein
VERSTKPAAVESALWSDQSSLTEAPRDGLDRVALQKLESDLSAFHSAAVKALSKIDTEAATPAHAQPQARDHLAPMNLGVGARLVLSSNQSERLNSAAAPVSPPETPRPSDIKPTNEVPRVPEDVGAVISEGHRSAFAEQRGDSLFSRPSYAEGSVPRTERGAHARPTPQAERTSPEHGIHSRSNRLRD